MTCLDQQNPPGWKTMPLNRMALPGTHDSQAYGLQQRYLWVRNKVGQENGAGDNCGAYKPVFALNRDAVVALSITQTANLREQLNRGVRVFDLRFAWPVYDWHLGQTRGFHDEWRGAHGAMVPWPMNVQLNELVTWAKEHPRELVIVKLTLCGSDMHNPPLQATRAESDLGIDNGSGLCGVSGRFPATPADIHVADVTAGHNVLVYYKDAGNGNNLGAQSALVRTAEKKCGWQYDHSQFQGGGASPTGPPVCKPGIYAVPGVPVHVTQERIRDKVNQDIQEQWFALAVGNPQFLYQTSPDFNQISLTWTPEAFPDGFARFVAHVCPQTLIENNDLFRGIGYKNSQGIKTRADLFKDFSRYAGIFSVDDIDKDFAKEVVALNLTRINDPITYAGLRGWMINGDFRRCFDLPNGQHKTATQFQLYPCNGSNPQSMTLTANGELQVKAGLDKCVDAEARNDLPSQAKRVISLYPCNHLDNQRWKLDTQGRIAGIGGECLTVKDKKVREENGNPVFEPIFRQLFMSGCGAGTRDKWTLFGTLRSATMPELCLTFKPDLAVSNLVLQRCRAGSPDQALLRTTSGQLKIQGKCIGEFPLPELVPCSGPAVPDRQRWEENRGQWFSLTGRCIQPGRPDPTIDPVEFGPCSESTRWRLDGWS
jgi:hypothetical protein